MSTLHYFQRYSSKENWLTNSTLLLLQHFYLYSPIKFQRYLNTLDEQLELKVGPVFLQQTRTSKSVPDGSIRQHPFNILIEAKPNGDIRLNQLKRHTDGFDESQNNILLILTKNDVANKEQYISKIENQSDQSVNVLFTTYQEIYDSLTDLLKEYDTEMNELLDDYAALCQERGLFQTAPHTMLGVSCSKSLTQNLKYQIYYDPVERNHNIPFNYLGIYNYKQIIAIGKLEKIVGCDLINENLKCTKNKSVFESLTSDERERIKKTIQETNIYNLRKGSKFFLLSDLTETSYKKKESAGVIRGKRYFYFKDVDGFKNDMPATELAKLVEGKEWG